MPNANLPAFVAELEATKPSAGHFTDTCPLDKRFTAVYVEHSLIAMAETRQKADRLVMKLNAVPALIELVRRLQGENATLQIQASKYAYERDLARRERDHAESLLEEAKSILKELQKAMGHQNPLDKVVAEMKAQFKDELEGRLHQAECQAEQMEEANG